MVFFLIRLVTDWLLAFLLAGLLVLLVVAVPVFDSNKSDVGYASDQTGFDLERRLKAHVHQLTELYAPRISGYEGLTGAADFIKQQLMKQGDVNLHFSHTLHGTYTTVSQSFGKPTTGDPNKAALIIAASYEARDESLDSEGNASGVAVLLELSRLLSRLESELPQRVELVAYTLSGGSGIGRNRSRKRMTEFTGKETVKDLHHAKKNRVILLDGVGRYNAEANSQSYPLRFMHYLYPHRGDFLQLYADLADFPFAREVKRQLNRNEALSVRSLLLPDYSLFRSNGEVGGVLHKNEKTTGDWTSNHTVVHITDTAGFRALNNPQVSAIQQLDYHRMVALVHGLVRIAMLATSTRTTAHDMAFQLF